MKEGEVKVTPTDRKQKEHTQARAGNQVTSASVSNRMPSQGPGPADKRAKTPIAIFGKPKGQAAGACALDAQSPSVNHFGDILPTSVQTRSSLERGVRGEAIPRRATVKAKTR